MSYDNEPEILCTPRNTISHTFVKYARDGFLYFSGELFTVEKGDGRPQTAASVVRLAAQSSVR